MRHRYNMFLWIPLSLLVVWVVWMMYWFSQSSHSGCFTPTELGTASNTAMILLTAVLAYYAATAFRTSQLQLEEMRKERKLQQLSFMVTEALQQFHQRKQDAGSAFGSALSSSFEYKSQEPKDVKDKRRNDFRTANYILKPLTYCCKWMLAHDWSKADAEFSKVMEMSALRILGGLSSAEHVYLLMATRLEINQIVLAYHVYERCYDSHIPICELLTIYAPKELWDCEAGNPGQMKKIDEMIETLGWKESAQVREQFFTCDVKS